ncbi:EF hand [Stieleria magnilauensis]|uniref:EF hand n=2 Tax=Stieleria magnilauensis TaxID=2527963 RepID=A0ABX5XIR6_9BACT|nr:EF hand [Planctomycetes bacterium TBK1r]
MTAAIALAGCDRGPKRSPSQTITTPDGTVEETVEPAIVPSPDASLTSETEREQDDDAVKSNPVAADPAPAENEAVAGADAGADISADVVKQLDAAMGEGSAVEVASDSADKPDSTEEPRAAYRLWLPTSKGPLLVDLDVWVDDQPLDDAFAEKLASVRATLKKSDEDAIGWDQLLEHVAGDPATFGQTASRVESQQQALIKRYDRNKDKRVDEQELVRFLFRDSNVSQAFRLFGTDAFRWANRSASPLYAAIDRNQDRKLDPTEIQQASESLLREIDLNSDHCIDFAELTRLRENETDAWRRHRSNRQGDVAMDLSGYVNWSNLSYTMGGMLKEDPVLHPSNPVKSIDADRDHWISEAEAESILTLAPALTLAVRFDSSDPSASTVETQAHAAVGDDVRIEHHPGFCWIAGQAFQVGAVALDMPTTQNRIPRQVFVQLDANKDGAIDESEIPDGAKDQFPLESLDQNGDGKLSFLEINQALQQKQSIWNFQVRGRAAEHPDGVFAWLDLDHDQFLSTREIQSASARLRALATENVALSASDIPDTLMIQFCRGEPDQDDARFQFSRRVTEESDERPSWAIHMDANRDGDVSENEFLGPIESFRELDRDDDLFLSAAEVREQ